jgi:hypothetical protein
MKKKLLRRAHRTRRMPQRRGDTTGRALRRRAAGLHFEVSVFSLFANSGLAFIAPAQPAS